LREYPPVGTNALSELANPKNQRVRAKHLFRTKKMDEVAACALSLANDIRNFVKAAEQRAQLSKP
ncbi:hypothetical protein, partial [Methylobrevis pamukkalensis]|uniref:hypothetical protein n=1 Tax=Methylobrevis pamukkalensis TaxID=1439726 RepID=UPI001AECBAD6